MSFADLLNEALFPRFTKTCTIQGSGTRRVAQIALCAGEGDEIISAPGAEGAIRTAVFRRHPDSGNVGQFRYCGPVEQTSRHSHWKHRHEHNGWWKINQPRDVQFDAGDSDEWE